MTILIIIGVLIVLCFLYSCMRISSECSRQEELRELLWLQQGSGRLKKD